MDQKPITLRAANPTTEDGLAFARFADAASEGFMRFLLGRRALEIVAKAYKEQDHDLSYQNVTFAESEGSIIGMILCYTAEQHRSSTALPLRRAAGRFRLRMRFLELVLSPLMHLTDSIEDNDYYLQFIAVDKTRQTKGVGSALMDCFEQQARESGSTRLSLDVSTKNEIARQFYEHLGWTVEWEWPKVRYIPSLSCRMIKKI